MCESVASHNGENFDNEIDIEWGDPLGGWGRSRTDAPGDGRCDAVLGLIEGELEKVG